MKDKMILKKSVLLVLTIILTKEVISKEPRLKKAKSLKAQQFFHHYEIHQSNWIPSDVQITTYLQKDIPKTFMYWSSVDKHSLSVVIMACSSKIEWNIFYHRGDNGTIIEKLHLNDTNITTKDIDIKYFMSLQGLYVLNAISREGNTYMHTYISTESNGPQALRSAMQNNLKIIRSAKKDWLTVRWEPSLVDPQRTDYCLVVNTKKHYTTVCSAELDVFHTNYSRWESTPDTTPAAFDTYPAIHCVGRKTHLKIQKVKPKVFYYFDLFAINKQSNLTYVLASAYKKFDGGHNSIPIKDGKFASLRKIEGKALFRFKVGVHFGNSLNIYIIPCGSYIYADIRLKGNTVVPQTRIDRFKNITIPSIVKGQRFIIRIIAPLDEFVNTGVEIYATTKPFFKSPLPTMPQNTTVLEYESLKKCNSVTLGWMPSLGETSATYCFIVKEGKMKENEGYSQPNQCGLESRLKKSLDFATFSFRFCKIIEHRNQAVITKEIKKLKPGKNYVILVSVKNNKGRSLFYKILQVNTFNCNKHKSGE